MIALLRLEITTYSVNLKSTNYMLKTPQYPEKSVSYITN